MQPTNRHRVVSGGLHPPYAEKGTIPTDSSRRSWLFLAASPPSQPAVGRGAEKNRLALHGLLVWATYAITDRVSPRSSSVLATARTTVVYFTLAVTTESHLTRGRSRAILRHPGCSALRWILGVGPHPHESRKTRHTVVCCILFIRDASSSRSRTPCWRRAIPAGQRPTSRADVPHSGDLPSSQTLISSNDRHRLDNPRKPGLLALLRDFWNRGADARQHGGGPGSW